MSNSNICISYRHKRKQRDNPAKEYHMQKYTSSIVNKYLYVEFQVLYVEMEISFKYVVLVITSCLV